MSKDETHSKDSRAEGNNNLQIVDNNFDRDEPALTTLGTFPPPWKQSISSGPQPWRRRSINGNSCGPLRAAASLFT